MGTGSQSYNPGGPLSPRMSPQYILQGAAPRRQIPAPGGWDLECTGANARGNDRQGKSSGLRPKGSLPGGAVEGEAPGYPCSSRLGAVHPVAKPEALPGRPSCSEPQLCQRNASQGQGRCQSQFTRGEGEELRRDSEGCPESGAPCPIPAATKPQALAEATPQPQRSAPFPQPGRRTLPESQSKEGRPGVRVGRSHPFQDRRTDEAASLCSWSHLFNHKITLPRHGP